MPAGAEAPFSFPCSTARLKPCPDFMVHGLEDGGLGGVKAAQRSNDYWGFSTVRTTVSEGMGVPLHGTLVRKRIVPEESSKARPD
jgi:hypothetical protein